MRPEKEPGGERSAAAGIIFFLPVLASKKEQAHFWYTRWSLVYQKTCPACPHLGWDLNLRGVLEKFTTLTAHTEEGVGRGCLLWLMAKMGTPGDPSYQTQQRLTLSSGHSPLQIRAFGGCPPMVSEPSQAASNRKPCLPGVPCIQQGKCSSHFLFAAFGCRT